MTEQEAFKILHPDTTVEAIAEIKYYAGFKGREAGIKAVEDACVVACEALEKQAEYKSLEEQGLLFRLPCAIGSTVWFVGNDFVNDYEIRRYIVDESGIDCIQIAKKIDGRDYWNSFAIDDFGKTVFLTQEEAEAALEKIKEGENGLD